MDEIDKGIQRALDNGSIEAKCSHCERKLSSYRVGSKTTECAECGVIQEDDVQFWPTKMRH